MAYKRISPQPVVEGGTGASTLTSHGVLLGNTTSAITATAAGTTGQVLTGVTGSEPTFQANAAFTSVVVQTFTSSGTYTPTAGMLYCTIEVVGSGGGGGGCASVSAHNAVGGGGGAGGYARKTVASATIGMSQTVTIGTAGTGGSAGNNPGITGGTSSVGVIVSATGGIGGSGGPSSVIATNQSGLGGVGSGGDINANGQPGGTLVSFDAGGIAFVMAPSGGSSIFGGGALGFTLSGNTGANGTNATVYGSGGGGAAALNLAGPNSGGNGSAGIVIITEYV